MEAHQRNLKAIMMRAHVDRVGVVFCYSFVQLEHGDGGFCD